MVILSNSLGVLRHHVENALYEYAAAADDLDAAHLGRLFASATVRFGSDTATGQDAIEALYADKFRSAPRVRHLLSNIRIEPDAYASLLKARCSYTRFSYTPGAELLSLGDYSAELEPLGTAGVRFHSFTVTPLWAAP